MKLMALLDQQLKPQIQIRSVARLNNHPIDLGHAQTHSQPQPTCSPALPHATDLPFGHLFRLSAPFVSISTRKKLLVKLILPHKACVVCNESSARLPLSQRLASSQFCIRVLGPTTTGVFFGRSVPVPLD